MEEGFNSLVRIPASCDFRTQYDLFNIIFRLFSSFIFFCRHIRFKWKSIGIQLSKFKYCRIIRQNAIEFALVSPGGGRGRRQCRIIFIPRDVFIWYIFSKPFLCRGWVSDPLEKGVFLHIFLFRTWF